MNYHVITRIYPSADPWIMSGDSIGAWSPVGFWR